jgi:hypothetical protein
MFKLDMSPAIIRARKSTLASRAAESISRRHRIGMRTASLVPSHVSMVGEAFVAARYRTQNWFFVLLLMLAICELAHQSNETVG